MVAITLVALILEAIGTLGLVNGRIGDRDPLKQRIGYWATACSIAFSVTIYFLGRWFTKDIYWQWRSGSKTWAATPSLFSVRLVADFGGLSGVAMGFSMTVVALVSFILNIWLTSMSHVSPYTFLSNPVPQNMSGISGYNTNGSMFFTSTGGAAFRDIVVQMTMGYIGKSQLSFYEGRYFWVPVFLPDQPATLFLRNLTTFSLNITCTQQKSTDLVVVKAQSGYNITNPCANFHIGGGRPMSNSWWMCQQNLVSDPAMPRFTPNPTTYIVQANSLYSLGPPSWSDDSNPEFPLSLYATKCITVIESWTVDAYISSYNTTRGQIQNAVQGNSSETLHVDIFMAYLFDGLSFFSMTTDDNDRGQGTRSPLWKYLVGWTQTSNITDISPWVANRLRTVITSIIDSSLITSNFTVTGQLLQESSIIRVNKAAVMAGILMQAMLVTVIMGLYLCYRTDEYHADDLDLLLEKRSNGNTNRTYELAEIRSCSQVKLTKSSSSSQHKLEDLGYTWL